jgi:rubrerythrin
MGKAGSDEEILKFAILRENEAHNFYQALASRAKEPPMQKLFEDLAAEELIHKEKLELELIKAGKTISTQLRPPRPVSEYIISDSSSQLDIDYKDVLLLGMEKEEASFRIYVNFIPNVHDEQSREVLLALAEEEVKHKLRFETEYNMLLKKS